MADPDPPPDWTTHAASHADGWARILRRHADECDKAASDATPDKWVADRAGWETLRDQLNEAAAIMNRLGDVISFHKVMENMALAEAVVKLAEMGIPADIQELLLQGDPARSIKPGALRAILGAT